MDPEVARLAQILFIVGTFTVSMVGMALAVRVVMFRTRPKSRREELAAPRVDDSRFARLEEAVDSIAVEVERIAEAQRFSAKLMSERLPERVAELPANRLPGK